MKLLEKYEELIERDPSEISLLWKYLHMFLYLLSASSGYICSVLFYMLEEEIFGGNCPLWATGILTSADELESKDILSTYTTISSWWRYLITDYKYDSRCKIYLITCFSSCMFGIVWFTLFLMCGIGGHSNSSIYQDPWRIVLPAAVFNFLFVIISTFAHYNLEYGYEAFRRNISNIRFEIYRIYNVVVDIESDCEIIKTYMNTHNFFLLYWCDIMTYIQIFSVIMICSWIGGLVLLLLRIIVINDFRILKIKIYEIKGE